MTALPSFLTVVATRCASGRAGWLRIFCCLMTILGGLCSPASSQQSPHGPLRFACNTCHTPQGWKVLRSPLRFDHDSTAFPLRAQHGSVACARCHQSLNFHEAPVRCVGCHQDLHRGELGGLCERCHTPNSWLVPDMAERHRQTQFPLFGPHLSAPCQSCHSNQQHQEYRGTPAECYACHRQQYDATAQPAHRQAGFGIECIQCHAPTAFQWGTGFDHQRTVFPLQGAHLAVPCSGCHKGGVFRGLPTDCYGCHQSQFAAVADPNHAAGGFSHECLSCHSMNGWRPATFNHATTMFPLTGIHATISCASCHGNGRFAGLQTQCVSCHLQQYSSAANPVHTPAQFPQDCQACHSTGGWHPAGFNHATTAFPLQGVHATVACNSCHKNGVFGGTPTQCDGCHESDYVATTNPAHVAGGFSRQCNICHSVTAWRPAQFDHAQTAFPLTGAHASQPCTACHINNVFTGTSTDCFACHATDFNGTTDPPHAAQGFSHQCGLCHSTTSWEGATFDHATTSFPLTGAHVQVACATCHANNNFVSVPTQCSGCHQQNFVNALSPPHQTGGFSTQCQTCHTTSTWSPSTFSHAQTAFPLTGAHVNRACTACHGPGPFASTPTQCVSCHQSTFNSSINPPHLRLAYPRTCDQCHTTTAWVPSTFSHAATVFPLTGKHTAVACAACHTGAIPSMSTTCLGCHRTDYYGTTGPAHLTLGYPTNCEGCHSTSVWSPSSFNHGQTGFPLTGIHASTGCMACHKNGNFAGTSTVCVNCHQGDYSRSVNPPHATQGYPTTCEQCHSTSGWTPSSFNHSQTSFPLTGIHATTLCTACHKNGSFSSTPTLCVSCHQADYNGSANPAHLSAGFPTDCQTCHTTSAWRPSTFNHTTYFPIAAGSSHPPGRWSTCGDCHNVPTNFRLFTCTTCHTQAKTNGEHGDVPGYTFDSNACYRCHPTGRGG